MMMSDWKSTAFMCEALGVSRSTLSRLKKTGFFRENHHFRKANPEAPRSNCLWHLTRTLLKMNAE